MLFFFNVTIYPNSPPLNKAHEENGPTVINQVFTHSRDLGHGRFSRAGIARWQATGPRAPQRSLTGASVATLPEEASTRAGRSFLKQTFGVFPMSSSQRSCALQRSLYSAWNAQSKVGKVGAPGLEPRGFWEEMSPSKWSLWLSLKGRAWDARDCRWEN